jgi:hypothetical protein
MSTTLSSFSIHSVLHVTSNLMYSFGHNIQNTIWCFLDRASWYILISLTNFNAQFLYSLTICMLHYNPRHVLSINIPIFRRTDCVITASGIVTLCKQLYSIPDESRLSLLSSGILYCTESDDTWCCDNTVCPPEDGHVNAQNMSRIVM